MINKYTISYYLFTENEYFGYCLIIDNWQGFFGKGELSRSEPDWDRQCFVDTLPMRQNVSGHCLTKTPANVIDRQR